MKKTKKEIIIHANYFEFKAPIYKDKQNYEYAKINKQFFSIDTLQFLGVTITFP